MCSEGCGGPPVQGEGVLADALASVEGKPRSSGTLPVSRV